MPLYATAAHTSLTVPTVNMVVHLHVITAVFSGGVAIVVATAHAFAADLVAVTDGIDYDARSTVQLRIEGSPSGTPSATIRYAGEDRPVAEHLRLSTDRSFAVHRKLARIASVELDRTFYTNGDPVACRVTVRHLTNKPLTGIRVEFGPFHYPWIAQPPTNRT